MPNTGDDVMMRDYSDFIIESIDTGIIVLDNDFKIVKWNSGMERLTGFGREEVIGKSYFEVFPHLEKRFSQIIRRVIETGSPYEINHYEHQTLRRGPIVINRRIYPLRNETGQIQGVVLITEDVTEKSLLEDRLRRKSQSLGIRVRELRTTIEIVNAMQSTNNLDAIFHIVLTGITAGKGLGYNRAMLFLVSDDNKWLEGKMGIGPVSKEEGIEIWESMHEDERSLMDMVLDYNDSIINTPLNQIVSQMRVPMSHRDSPFVKPMNQRQPVRWRNPPRDEYMQKLNLTNFVSLPILSYVEPFGVLIVDNITSDEEIDSSGVETLQLFATQVAIAIEKVILYESLDEQIAMLRQANEEIRAIQEQLLQSERMATIGQMAAIMAHNIRNPVITIGGYGRLILKRMNESDPLRDFAAAIVEESDKLEDVLKRNLDFIEPVELNLREAWLNNILSSAISLIKRESDRKRISLHSSLSEEDMLITADQYQLIYAFLQILRNAVQASPENGEIQVSSRLSEDGKFAIVEIVDKGIGMPEEVLARVFDPFFTTDRLRSGLGLTTTKRIIEGHGGKIEIQSRVNEGTRVTVSLPCRTSKG